MIAQFILSILLAGILLYAWTEYRRSPVVALLTLFVAGAGLYFVWVPDHSTQLAELVGIGRGVDLILYTWVCISLIVLLNLHLKLRTQMELITTLARKVALADASRSSAIADSIVPAESDLRPADAQASGLQLSERRA
jgi:hypothetical protein